MLEENVLTSFFSLISLSCPCRCNSYEGKSMLHFVVDFEIDQISYVTLTSDFYGSNATVSFKTWPFCQRLGTNP